MSTRTPVKVLEAPDGHDVIIEGRLDVHSVPDIRDAIHAVIATGAGEVASTWAVPRSAMPPDSGSSCTCTAAPPGRNGGSCSSTPSDRTRRLLRGCRLDRILASRHAAPAAVTVAPLTA